MNFNQCFSLVRASARCYGRIFQRAGMGDCFLDLVLGDRGSWYVEDLYAAQLRRREACCGYEPFISRTTYGFKVVDRCLREMVWNEYAKGMNYLDICYAICRFFRDLGEDGPDGNRVSCGLDMFSTGVGLKRKLAFLRREKAFWASHGVSVGAGGGEPVERVFATSGKASVPGSPFDVL